MIDVMIGRVSNWGRFGEQDELGTMNFVTQSARVRARDEVITGETISLAIPLDRSGPQPPGNPRLNPQHVMLQTGTELRAGVQPGSLDGWGYADDMVTMALQAGTHWDGLSHQFHDYRMYNDRDCTLVSCDGAAKNGIETQRESAVMRGVLLDVPRALGVAHLPIDHEITVAELEFVLDRERVEVRSGDALLIRTGNLGRARADGGWDRFTHDHEPGIGLAAAPWLHEHEIAAVASDTWAFEAIPSGTPILLPLHAVGIVHMGLLIGELFDLDRLASRCADDARYTCLLAAAPLPFTGAVGAPVNPIAIR